MTLRITTLIIMTFSITILDIDAQNDTNQSVLDVMTLLIVTHIHMPLSSTISLKLAKCYTQHYGSHHNYIQHKDSK